MLILNLWEQEVTLVQEAVNLCLFRVDPSWPDLTVEDCPMEVSAQVSAKSHIPV